MKYFTNEKYENNTAWLDYEAYCKSIWKDLPNDLKLINEGMLPESMMNIKKSIGLHDGKITNFIFNKVSSKLNISVNTDNQGALRQTELEYITAKVLQDVSSDRKGKNIDDPDSDIVCHEIMHNNGVYIHMLLFASGEELIIEFQDFRMNFKDE